MCDDIEFVPFVEEDDDSFDYEPDLDNPEYASSFCLDDVEKRIEEFERFRNRAFDESNEEFEEYIPAFRKGYIPGVSRNSFLYQDPDFLAWLIERGTAIGLASLWQEACADYFFLQECDGKCNKCHRLDKFKRIFIQNKND